MYVRNTVSYFLEVDLTSSLRPCLLDGGKYRLSQSWGFTWTLAKMLIFFFFLQYQSIGTGQGRGAYHWTSVHTGYYPGTKCILNAVQARLPGRSVESSSGS